MKKTIAIVSALAAVFVALPGVASAQTAAAPQGRIFIGANFGFQTQSQQFDEAGSQSMYDETAYFAGVHKIESGQLLDGSVAYRVWQRLSVGAAVSRFADKQDLAVGLTLPHPLYYGRTRTATASVAGLEHTEFAVHIQATWRQPVLDKFEVAVSAGPTLFSVSQDMLKSIEIAEAGSPFTSVNVTSATVVGQKKNATGFHAQADVSYRITSLIGVGAFARYAKGSVEFAAASEGGSAVKLDLGGLQVGGGLRITF